jgi:hypothetical protein
MQPLRVGERHHAGVALLVDVSPVYIPSLNLAPIDAKAKRVFSEGAPEFKTATKLRIICWDLGGFLSG